MKKSDTITKLVAALVKAQAQFETAEMDGYNPHFKSKFATLKSVVAAIRPALTKNGLAIMQFPSADASGKPLLETIITHESGEWISESAPLILSKQDMQGLGASVTYLKRISLSAVTGVVADEDDDGNSTQKKQNAAQTKSETSMTVSAKDVPPCIHCGSVLFYNTEAKEHYCPKYKDKKKHVTGLNADRLEEYKVFYAENKEKQMGLRMPKI